MSTPANMEREFAWRYGSAWGPVILPVFKCGEYRSQQGFSRG